MLLKSLLPLAQLCYTMAKRATLQNMWKEDGPNEMGYAVKEPKKAINEARARMKCHRRNPHCRAVVSEVFEVLAESW